VRPAIRFFFMFALFASLARPSIAATPAAQSGPGEVQAIQGQVKAVDPANAERLDPNVFRYGPIQAKDPAVQEQIKNLYKEQWDLQQSTLARLHEINESVSDVSDPDVLQALTKEGIELKQTLLRRHMELGLQIARLNEDAQRIADFEKALDQLLHPEKWMPVSNPDPELRARRERELGLSK
jgi:hypothetical protein